MFKRTYISRIISRNSYGISFIASVFFISRLEKYLSSPCYISCTRMQTKLNLKIQNISNVSYFFYSETLVTSHLRARIDTRSTQIFFKPKDEKDASYE